MYKAIKPDKISTPCIFNITIDKFITKKILTCKYNNININIYIVYASQIKFYFILN